MAPTTRRSTAESAVERGFGSAILFSAYNRDSPNGCPLWAFIRQDPTITLVFSYTLFTGRGLAALLLSFKREFSRIEAAVCPASAPMRQIGRVEEGSDCLVGQAGIGCHGRLSRRIALRIVISLRATATRAMSFGLPAATSLSRKFLSCGL